MIDQARTGQAQKTRAPWQTPAFVRIAAGSAESGQGASGETSSLS